MLCELEIARFRPALSTVLLFLLTNAAVRTAHSPPPPPRTRDTAGERLDRVAEEKRHDDERARSSPA